MDVEPLFLRGKDAADRGNYDYAIALLRDALKADPTHRMSRILLRGCEMKKFESRGAGGKARAEAFFKGIGPLVKMQLSRSKPEKAADAAEAYLANDPTNVFVLVTLAKALERASHFEAAADTLEFARQRAPRHIGVLRLLGEVLYALGQYDKAVRCCQEILSIRPQDREASENSRTWMAKSHLERSNLEQSQSFREQLRDETKANKLAQADRMVRTSDDLNDDVARFKKATEENPADAEAHMKLAGALEKAERLPEAEAAYRKAFEVGKKWSAREKFGDIHLRLLEQAEENATKAAEEHPEPANVARATEAKRKRLEFAIKEFEVRRKQHPTEMKLAFQLGQYYFDLGGEEAVKRAMQQFQAAVSSVPLKARAQLMLGRCFAFNPKTLDMAKEQFVKAYELMEDDQSEMAKSLLYELGETCEKMGNKAEALTWYKKVFSVDAGYRDVTQKIQQLG